MSRKADIDAFCQRISYKFSDWTHLEEALTHSSFKVSVGRDNQRLEFLGDRVLGLVIAERLIGIDPEAAEGKLAPRLNSLVRKEACAEVGAEVELGQVLRMGRSEMQSGGRRKTAILGDAMEAVIAAVYLDGGYSSARSVILELWKDKILNVNDVATDAKTALQEWAQARGMAPPVYKELSRRGPDHAPLFVVEAKLENGSVASAEARSKRQAQQTAADLLMKSLRETE